MRSLEQLLEESTVFAGLDPARRSLIAGCGRNVVFAAGDHLFRQGEPADTFWLLRRGRVALLVHVPGRGDLTVETIEAGDVVGWSWLFPPYTWQYDARAVDDVHAIAFDGQCLRGKCDEDHALGYDLMRRFGSVMVDRLQHTRMRLIDVYGHHPRD
jgi:CRP-like cAMP-binding protein